MWGGLAHKRNPPQRMVGCFANPSYSFILGGRRLATLELTDLYRSMLLIRRTEQLLSKLFANGIVGAGMSLALGSALALQVRKTRNVASVFFGDGAMAEGLLRECMNLASLWKLPMLSSPESRGFCGCCMRRSLSACTETGRKRGPVFTAFQIFFLNKLIAFGLRLNSRHVVQRCANALQQAFQLSRLRVNAAGFAHLPIASLIHRIYHFVRFDKFPGCRKKRM